MVSSTWIWASTRALCARLLLCTTQTFDSLPHAQSIANTLGVFGLTHKQAYKELFVTTVIFPTIFSIFCCICCILFYPV